MGALSRSTNWFVKTVFISIFRKIYQVDLTDAQRKSPRDYASFEDFFTRELDPSARPICDEVDSIVSPVDGVVAQSGTVQSDTLVQAKGLEYSLNALLGEPASQYEGGDYVVLYLSPKDYHRIHAPLTLNLEKTTEIPGLRFPVNAAAATTVPDLFARNVRLVCHFKNNGVGFIGVFVGALIVSGIKTRFDSLQTPFAQQISRSFDQLTFEKGEELARFVLGSTVILVLPAALGRFDSVAPGEAVRLGQKIGTLKTPMETA